MLESNVPSGQGVAQLVLVANERHEAYVGLHEDGLVQLQDTVGLPRNRLQGMGFLGCPFQLLTEILDLWTKGESGLCVRLFFFILERLPQSSKSNGIFYPLIHCNHLLLIVDS